MSIFQLLEIEVFEVCSQGLSSQNSVSVCVKRLKIRVFLAHAQIEISLYSSRAYLLVWVWDIPLLVVCLKYSLQSLKFYVKKFWGLYIWWNLIKAWSLFQYRVLLLFQYGKPNRPENKCFEKILCTFRAMGATHHDVSEQRGKSLVKMLTNGGQECLLWFPQKEWTGRSKEA